MGDDELRAHIHDRVGVPGRQKEVDFQPVAHHPREPLDELGSGGKIDAPGGIGNSAPIKGHEPKVEVR